MENFELKVGDLVKLRDDLIDGKEYDGIYYTTSRYFKGFKKIDEIINDNAFIIYSDDYEECFCYTKEMIAEVKRPTKYETIYKREEPILDDKEKKYLSSVIRPFRDRVQYIVKRGSSAKEYIVIEIKNENIYLPYFKKDTMYKNMKLEKNYTLEELGLWIRYINL